MVDILCPHCEEEIGLDNDASGEFSCPYCDGKFEYESESITEEQAEELVEMVESGNLDPDFVIKDENYTEEGYWKVIQLIVAAMFIPLFGIGLVFIYFLLKEPIETTHTVDKIIYIQAKDVILFYKTNNDVLDNCEFFQLADDATITYTSSTSFDGAPDSMIQLVCPSTNVVEILTSEFDSDWNGFADYRNLEFIDSS